MQRHAFWGRPSVLCFIPPFRIGQSLPETINNRDKHNLPFHHVSWSIFAYGGKLEIKRISENLLQGDETVTDMRRDSEERLWRQQGESSYHNIKARREDTVTSVIASPASTVCHFSQSGSKELQVKHT